MIYPAVCHSHLIQIILIQQFVEGPTAVLKLWIVLVIFPYGSQLGFAKLIPFFLKDPLKLHQVGREVLVSCHHELSTGVDIYVIQA